MKLVSVTILICMLINTNDIRLKQYLVDILKHLNVIHAMLKDIPEIDVGKYGVKKLTNKRNMEGEKIIAVNSSM